MDGIDAWSGDDEGNFGGNARSLEIRHSHGSGVNLFMGDYEEYVVDSQLSEAAKRGKKVKELKVLAAKRVLKIQKESGVSFPSSEGGIIEKLVRMEDVAAKLKASREDARVAL